tara:strand:- start:1120 stop:1479 length:360 start_codon:yes stop_codon:yes gene_type:complete
VFQAKGAVGAPVPDTHERPSVLVEAELFKSSITGGNKIRMAARYLENIYADAIEPETRRSVWNPAYAASIIWTAAGNKIQTRIESCPYFTTPAGYWRVPNMPKPLRRCTDLSVVYHLTL